MSAYYAIQYSNNDQIATPSTFLQRIPSKTSMSYFPDNQIRYGSNAPTRNNSTASIAALPSLSNSLNRLSDATSMEQLAIQSTRGFEGEETVRNSLSASIPFIFPQLPLHPTPRSASVSSHPITDHIIPCSSGVSWRATPSAPIRPPNFTPHSSKSRISRSTMIRQTRTTTMKKKNTSAFNAHRVRLPSQCKSPRSRNPLRRIPVPHGRSLR